MDDNDINKKNFEIPNDNKQLKLDIANNKEKYMSFILDNFLQFIKDENNIPEKINLFKFKNTNLEIVVKKESYVSNLNNLLDFYSDIEEYETCKLIKSLITKINNVNED